MKTEFGFRRSIFAVSVSRFFPIFIVLVLALGGGQAMLGQDDEPLSNLQFLVLRDYNGKPVHNAAVVLHPVNVKGKQARVGMELKTDTEGKTSFDGVPYGLVRVQVLAQGFQTYGEDFKIDKPSLAITVKLKRPQGQFSVYDDPKTPPDNKKQPDTKPQ